jgi:hypothetical protein
MTEAVHGRRGRDDRKPRTTYKRPGELGERIRVQVHVPEELGGTAQPNSAPEIIQAWNALLEDLHNQAIFAAWDAKLKLLLRHYSLADDDWHGLALILAVEHEAGFQIDRQIAPLPPRFWGAVEIKDGKIVDDTIKKPNRPLVWSFRRLLELLEDVQTEKKKSGCSKDLDALRHLARRNWKPPVNHRGENWIRTLQKRLSQAKREHSAVAPEVAKLRAKAKILQRQLAE